jgi:hypothetical protein
MVDHRRPIISTVILVIMSLLKESYCSFSLYLPFTKFWILILLSVINNAEYKYFQPSNDSDERNGQKLKMLNSLLLRIEVKQTQFGFENPLHSGVIHETPSVICHVHFSGT